eukprot:g790.t1
MVHAQLSKATEKTALVALRDSVSRPGTSFYNTWDALTDPCMNSWPGVVCDGDGFVVKLIVNRMRMAGTIPVSFYDFPRLTYIDFSGNQLTGKIPGAIWFSFPQLVHLNLSRNFFVGTVPSEIGDIPNIQYFDVNDCNQLTGLIPRRIARRVEEEITVVRYSNTQLRMYSVDEEHIFDDQTDPLTRDFEPVFYRLTQPEL